VEHTFTHFHLELDVWRAVSIADGELLAAGDYRWTARNDLAGEALPTVMRKVVAHVLDTMTPSPRRRPGSSLDRPTRGKKAGSRPSPG
jgi:A/G-specific adenine glycosylase